MDDHLELMSEIEKLRRLSEGFSKPEAETTKAKRHIRELLRGKRRSVPLTSLLLLSRCEDPMPEWAAEAFGVEGPISYEQAVRRLRDADRP